MKSNPTANEKSRDPVEKMVRFSYGLAVMLSLIVVSLGLMKGPVPQKESYFSFYADSFFNEFHGWIAYVAAFLSLGAAAYSITRWIMNSSGEEGFEEKRLIHHLKRQADRWLRKAYEMLRMVFPIFLNLFLLSYIVGYVNSANQHRWIDSKLAAADFWLTGTYPFLTLETIKFPVWLIEAVELSFLNLPFLLVIAALYVFFKNKRSFSKYVMAFFLSFAIMTPIWLLVPAMSPQDRFIDDVYQLRDPHGISSALQEYPPVPQVKRFLTHMRQSKKGLEMMPTTTFPSSHAAWATLAAICLLEASPVAAAVLGPFLLLSTLGTFYLAQHYFVDTLAGVTIGVISTLLASVFFRRLNDEPSTAKKNKKERSVPAISAASNRVKV
ncbi:MAG: phosphatase PAP2 family protein [Bacteroidetes bacterium]|nr:phosphatase PAP2 family protein [Bacteroidota bacterium]